MMLKVAFFVITLSLLPQTLWSADEVVNFDNPQHQVMYQKLLQEYRCLKCQNQNLWDSNASLAGDLRREIREQILAGKSQADIDEFLVARYGEFVLYRPRFNARTAVLWIGPFVLLGIALIVVLRLTGQRKKPSDIQTSVDGEIQPDLPVDQQRLQRAREALDKS